MRRRHEGQAEVRCLGQAVLDTKAVIVHLDWNRYGSDCDEGVAGADRSGILKPDRLAWIDQHTTDQGKSALGAVCYEYLLG